MMFLLLRVSFEALATYVVKMRIAGLGILMALMLAGSAGAATYTVIPPSVSSANQYVESVPTAGGNRSSLAVTRGQSGATTSSGTATPLPASTQAALLRQGRDGRRAAYLARATAPARARGAGGRQRSHGPLSSGPSGGSSGGGSAPASTVLGSLVGLGTRGGLGAALPVALIVIAFWMGGLVLRRRRTH